MTFRISGTELRLALSEIYPDASYGAVPVINQFDALEAYRAFDDGALAEAPFALAAYIQHHQHSVA
ncbi:MAG: hypothetical protein L0Y45_12255 [Woeseiaceae bacterium]|nr:hypothetical protein [Woeseiaceae bacterium]